MSQSAIIHDQVVVFSKSLSKLVGVNGAVIIQQIRFALSQPRSGVMLKEHKWIWSTYEDWHRDWFPFWSINTIKRAFQEMERRGFIVSCQPGGHMSRKKYYRLSDGMSAKLTIEAAENVNLADSRTAQNGSMEGTNVSPSITDTSQKVMDNERQCC